MVQHCWLLIPDGSLEAVVLQLLAEVGIIITFAQRQYWGIIKSHLFSAPDNIAYKLRPQDMPWLIAAKKAKIGFTGTDLVAEARCGHKLQIVRRLPLSRGGVGGTRIVLAVQENSSIKSVGDLQPKHLVVTEYPNLARRWFNRQKVRPQIRTCHGSLEAYRAFADAIVENVETGTSLAANHWKEVETILESGACIITYPGALKAGRSKQVIEELCILIDAVMAARGKVLLKCNVPPSQLLRVLACLPSPAPTVSPLANEKGSAVEAVVQADEAPKLIVHLKQEGATDIIQSAIAKLVP